MSFIGKPIPRKEDDRLLAGRGCYADDLSLPGQAHACMVRSPHAHARILSIGTEQALQTPGVLAVLTGQDAAADGLKPIPHRPVTVNPHEVALRNRDGSPFRIPPCAVLPTDKARFVGEAVAMVIAENAMAAHVNFKTVIVVDADVDIFDPADVLWALATRARWDRGFVPVPGAHGNELDPSSDEHGIVAKVIIDATLPADKRSRYLKVAYPPVDLKQYL